MKNKANNIFIIGAGAIGKVLAVLLKLAGKNVVIIRGSVDNGSNEIVKIEVELSDGSALEAPIEISSLSKFELLDGIIVLTNKSYGNIGLAQTLKQKIINSPIVLLQNGLNIEQAFIDNNFSEIYRCVLFATSQNIADNKLRFKPVSASLIGAIKNNANDLDAIVAALNTTVFPFKAEKNIQPIIWKKAIINSVFNSVCPLLEIDNGIFYKDENILAIAKRVITECVAVANKIDIQLTVDEVVNGLLQISKAADGQLISTYQDIKNKRRTEIDTLNFAIVEVASKLNMENAVVETKVLGEMVRYKSDLSL